MKGKKRKKRKEKKPRKVTVRPCVMVSLLGDYASPFILVADPNQRRKK